MTKKALSLLLAIVMVLGMIPPMRANALTYEMADAVIVNNVALDDGYYVLNGSTEPKKGMPSADSDYAYFKDQVLYLKNFDVTTYRNNRVDSDKWVKCGIGLFQYTELYWDDSYLGSLINDFPLRIHLTGENRITDSSADYAIYACYNATVTFTGSGTLEMNRPIEVTGGITVKGGNFRMTESGAGDKVPMIKTASFKMMGGDLNMRAAYRSGIECTDFVMSSGNLDLNVLGNSQYTGSGLLTTGGVSIAGGAVKIQSDGDAVRCSSLSIQNGIESVEIVSTGSGQDSSYMAVDASTVTLPTDCSTVVSENADGSSKTVLSGNYSGNLAGYDYVKCAKPVTYIIAKSTEPIAGTVNTAPIITIAPECHCKVSDYAEGYWLYYTKGLGWRRMEENTKFEVGKDYAYYFAIETTDGYTFPADGGNVNGILECDQGYFGADVNRVDGRDDVAEMMLSYQPCTYGAPLEFIDQTPVFVEGSYANTCEVEGFPGETITFSFNHQPLTAAQKAQGYEVRRTFLVYQGLANPLHTVQKDTGTQPLSFSFTIDQTQTYLVAESIELVKNGTVLQTKSIMYMVKVVSNGTPVIFTADSSNAFGGTVTVDIDAMAKKDANLKTALDNGTVKYQWYRGYTQIPGATGQSYTFHADDVGKDIRVTVVYGDNGSISEPFTVTGTAPAFTQQPTGGNVAPGKNMTVKWATNFTPAKIVVESYNFVGLASEYAVLSGTATSTALPANEYGYVIKAYYNDNDFIISDKFTVVEVETPADPEVTRLSGKNRVLTSFAVANQLKERMGIEKFKTVVVAYGRNFPDALAGSYLAARKGAPILLTENGADNNVLTYLEENLVSGGKVYILGGTAAVSQSFEDSAKMKGYNVNRLKGKDRYLTNLEILKEAGMNGTDEILIATGTNFADSLSASATGLPIVLVGKTLTAAQKDFLTTSSRKFVIIGGTGAVSEAVEAELAQIGTVERIKGKSRYETSVVIAERYFANPTAAILAYAQDFPDGLCGGPLAYKLGAPLILTSNTNYAAADAYIEGITSGAVTGGTARLTDKTVREIFDLEDDVEIPVN